MGRLPFAGVAWQVLHYLEGLRRLGADVFYIEDTGAWPYDPERNAIVEDGAYAARYIRNVLQQAALEDKWAFVAPTGSVYGLGRGALRALYRGTDILINLTGATVLRDEHSVVPTRVYLETDPVTPQIEIAQGRRFTIDLLAAHTHHFTFGENIGLPGCRVPVERFRYIPTRQPVILDWWDDARATRNGELFTTIASWRQPEKEIAWRGETYHWSKDREFAKVLTLPAHAGVALELALACDDEAALAALASNGWRVRDALPLSRTLDRYREYIVGSRGEFTVAKDQNVRLGSGRFSDRSACYLAASRPVVTQATGFDRSLPTGDGLFAFSTLDGAAQALKAVQADYHHHARAAREIAWEFFRAEHVLRAFLDALDADSQQERLQCDKID
jgi:hypothetical protein